MTSVWKISDACYEKAYSSKVNKVVSYLDLLASEKHNED